ncbi:hypothetical protein GCM10010976_09560 [Bizionia arctica]|uniref:Peptidase M56 domain-containing protein n=2 Tax=Bizionia arctica TaxID=1495645 RepID=A0A917LKW3_9FLAO|nr:hypothetical protein GCM10010976_09560 [Bizionia arctica]
MHIFKRVYLLASLIISIGIPFITFTQIVEAPITINEAAINNSTSTPLILIEESVNYLPYILWAVYLLGVLFFGLKFIYNLSSILLKISRNPKLKTQKSINVLLEELIVPHTFLKYIFLNKILFESQKIPKEVLIHEEAHVYQKHSLDILFIEIFQIVLWFNPLIYLLKRDIKLNHEFLADREVIKKGITLSAYQQILLAFSSNVLEPQLATAINYSSIKKRFTVMKTSSSKTGIWLRSIVLLPILALLIYSFSTKDVIEKETKVISEITPEAMQETIATINGVPCNGCTVNLTKEAAEKFILGTNTGEAISSFVIKFIGKPAVKITGNTLNKEAVALLYENPMSNLIQIFSIRPTTSHIKMPIVIQLVDKNDENYTNSPIVKEGEKSFIPPPPPPPATPAPASKMKKANDLPPPPPHKSAYDYVLSLKNDNISYSYNGKAVSYDEILKITQKEPYIIITTNIENHAGTVRFTSIEEQNKVQNNMAKKGEMSNIPPPPPPKAPLDFVIEMAKKNAAFYYEEKSITSDEAIKLLKDNKSINISSKNSTSKNPEVYLSKEPITIDD